MARATPIPGISATTPIAAAAPRVLAVRLDELARHLERVPARVEAEDVHDARVATRRLRAALRLFGGPLAPAGRGVKHLADALGPLRDADVKIAWLLEASKLATVEEQPGIDHLLADRREALPALEVAARKAIARYRRHLEPTLRAHLATAGADGLVGEAAIRKTLARRMKQIATRVDELSSVEDAAAAHALRVALKKARYELELVEEAFGPLVVEALGEIRKLQEILGEVHDRDVRLALLPSHVAGADALLAPGAVRLLRDTVDERRRLAEELSAQLAGAADRARAVAARLRDVR